MTKKLRYEFTQDKKYLRQYFKLITRYKQLNTNKNIHVLIVRDGQKCVGGLLMTVSSRSLDENKSEKYAEISGFTLLNRYKYIETEQKMYRCLDRKAKQIGIKKLFICSERSQIKKYLRNIRYLKSTLKLCIL